MEEVTGSIPVRSTKTQNSACADYCYNSHIAGAFFFQTIVNVGMNIGVLPVTGITIPFMSYGGTHLLTEFMGLGILMGMRRYRREAPKDMISKEFLGV